MDFLESFNEDQQTRNCFGLIFSALVIFFPVLLLSLDGVSEIEVNVRTKSNSKIKHYNSLKL